VFLLGANGAGPKRAVAWRMGGAPASQSFF
jgi:hypothetical protein